MQTKCEYEADIQWVENDEGYFKLEKSLQSDCQHRERSGSSKYCLAGCSDQFRENFG